MITNKIRNAKTDISAVVAKLEARGATKIKRRTNTYSIAVSFHLKGGPKHPQALHELACAMCEGTGWTHDVIGQAMGDFNYVMQICPEGTL